MFGEGKTDECARHKTQWGKTQTSSFLLNKEFCPSQKISLDTKKSEFTKEHKSDVNAWV